ncbi:YaiI/YqxD family protein [Bacillaceae bacterium S4-13-58]
MQILVDADACPVKDIVIEVAVKNQLHVKLVRSFSHFSTEQYPDGIESVYVDTGADSVDYRIVQLAQSGDLIITQDYGLAALGLGKGCRVIHHLGYEFTTKNIDELLSKRHAHAKLRRSGHKTKGPKKFTEEDRQQFRKLLSSIILHN